MENGLFNLAHHLKATIFRPAFWIPLSALLVSIFLPLINLCGWICSGIVCCGDYTPIDIFAYAAIDGNEYILPLFLGLPLFSMLLVLIGQGTIKVFKIIYSVQSAVYLFLTGRLFLGEMFFSRPTSGLKLLLVLLILQFILSFFPFSWRALSPF